MRRLQHLSLWWYRELHSLLFCGRGWLLRGLQHLKLYMWWYMYRILNSVLLCGWDWLIGRLSYLCYRTLHNLLLCCGWGQLCGLLL